MKKFILIAVLIAFYCVFGCAESGPITVETGGAESESTVEDSAKVEQSQIDELAELVPALVCTECNLAQMEATGRMFEMLSALVAGQQVLPDGQQNETPLTPTQINIAIDAYSSAVNTLTEGEDTMTTEAAFEDQIDDLLDSTDTNTPGEVV